MDTENTGMTAEVDVADLVAKKFGRRLSRPVEAFLKWFIKQDEINAYLRMIGPRTGVDFMSKAIEVLDVKINVKGEENLPAPGSRCMFVCNHPLGGVDVLAAVSVVGKHYPEGIKIPANDLLMALSGIKDMLIPVNKVGGQHKDLSEKIRCAFESSSQLMFFPAGKVSRRHGGKVMDDEWKKNFVCKSVESRRSVIPIRIDACNSSLFYNISKIRNRLRVKFNIEMLMLPRELFKQRGRTIDIIIGEPIDYRFFDNTKTFKQWAQEVRRAVYNLG